MAAFTQHSRMDTTNYHLANNVRNISHLMLYTKPLQLWVSKKLARIPGTCDLAMISDSGC